MQKLGFLTEVVDKVTGLRGKVTHYAVHKSGCNTYLVQPPVDKDSKVPEAHWIAEQSLDPVGEVLAVEPTTPQVFPFEAVVRDVTSGLVGKVVAFSVQVFGANRYTIQPAADLSKEKPFRSSYWFDEQNLELVEQPSAAAEKRQEELKTKKPGGPPSMLR